MVYPDRVVLNINTKYVMPIPYAQQGDTARVLTFSILDKGVPFNLQGKTVRARIAKPDKTKCYNDLTITNATNGECTLKLTNQVLAVAGKVNCQLEIKEGEELLSTIIFSIDVEPSIDISGAAESTNEFTALENGIIKLDEWDKYFKETSGAIEEKYTERLNGIDSSLEEKVNKEQGKGLSTNDYDNVAKAEVAKIKNKADTTRVDDLERQIGQGVTDEQLKNAVQAKVDDGTINTIQVGKDGVDTINLRDESVTVEKTDFAEKVEVGTSDVILNDLFTITGQLSVSNGVLKTGVTTSKATDFIDISNVKYLFRYVLDGSSSGKFKDFEICFYTKEEVFISGMSRNTDYTVEKYGDKFGCYYPIPHNAEKVRFSCSEANCIGGSGNLYTYLKVESVYDTKLSGRYYESYIEEKINNSPNKPLQGKEIALVGDSIFGNFRDETGIPSIVGKITGAKVYNLGLGGTRMSGRNDSNSQAQYWDKFSFCRIVDYIETGDFSPMRNALPNMSSALPYFGEVITMYENMNWLKISILVIEYATNDATGGNVIYDSENPNNIYAFNNAYRYSIEKLLTLYPHLRIIIVTPAWRFWNDSEGNYIYDSDTHVIAGQKLTDFVRCDEEIADNYHIGLINSYKLLGANKFTRLQYFNPTDGTHHNENGRLRYGSLIAHQLEVLL
jgi:hypothetical protein|nr:SGNH/GDSL hydrolase family protein [uncultured Lachnoclostridium sp.]